MDVLKTINTYYINSQAILLLLFVLHVRYFIFLQEKASVFHLRYIIWGMKFIHEFPFTWGSDIKYYLMTE
jgi:hypothetical protein